MPNGCLSVNIQTMHAGVFELAECDHGMVAGVHALARVVLQVTPEYKIVAGIDHVGGVVEHFQVFGDEEAEEHVTRVVPLEFQHVLLLGHERAPDLAAGLDFIQTYLGAVDYYCD